QKKSTFTIRVFTRSRGVSEEFGNFYRLSRLQVTKSTWSSRLGSEVDSPSRDSTFRVTATLAECQNKLSEDLRESRAVLDTFISSATVHVRTATRRLGSASTPNLSNASD
ncbi:hypothetical protein B0H19DRAFT_1235744, partial [Mycena capillaripes]